MVIMFVLGDFTIMCTQVDRFELTEENSLIISLEYFLYLFFSKMIAHNIYLILLFFTQVKTDVRINRINEQQCCVRKQEICGRAKNEI